MAAIPVVLLLLIVIWALNKAAGTQCPDCDDLPAQCPKCAGEDGWDE